MATDKTPASREEVLSKLGEGWEIYDRGTGWWLCEPRQAYKRAQSLPVTEETVNALLAEGLVESELLTRSVRVTLVEQKDN